MRCILSNLLLMINYEAVSDLCLFVNYRCFHRKAGLPHLHSNLLPWGKEKGSAVTRMAGEVSVEDKLSLMSQSCLMGEGAKPLIQSIPILSRMRKGPHNSPA